MSKLDKYKEGKEKRITLDEVIDRGKPLIAIYADGISINGTNTDISNALFYGYVKVLKEQLSVHRKEHASDPHECNLEEVVGIMLRHAENTVKELQEKGLADGGFNIEKI